jgi:hypothetical protein
MPLFLYYSPSFVNSLKRLGADQKKIVANILRCLKIYYRDNCDFAKTKEIAPGFFYKQLQKPYYESGIESNMRIVLRRQGQKCIAVLAGNHDQIKRFLARA